MVQIPVATNVRIWCASLCSKRLYPNLTIHVYQQRSYLHGEKEANRLARNKNALHPEIILYMFRNSNNETVYKVLLCFVDFILWWFIRAGTWLSLQPTRLILAIGILQKLITKLGLPLMERWQTYVQSVVGRLVVTVSVCFVDRFVIITLKTPTKEDSDLWLLLLTSRKLARESLMVLERFFYFVFIYSLIPCLLGTWHSIPRRSIRKKRISQCIRPREARRSIRVRKRQQIIKIYLSSPKGSLLLN